MRKPSFIEEDIEFTGWANGGAALGRLSDGRVVFAEGVLPGERARVRFADKESRYILGEVTRLLTRSPLRIEPRCPLYGKCRGCCLQNLEYPDQLHAKREILIDHLTRIAGLKNAEELVRPMLAAPVEWNWARSLILGLDEEGRFCMPAKNGGLIPLEAFCPITAECLNEVLVSFTFEPDSGISELEFRADDGDGIQLILRGETDKPENEMENDTEISVVYQGPESSWVMAGVSTLQQKAAGISVCASDSSPFINNPASLDVICSALTGLLPGIEKVSLLDVGCGTGFWSRWFGSRCKAVNALMVDENQCEDFVYNLDDLDNAALYIGNAGEILPGLSVPDREWVLIEGGNTGLSEPVLSALCIRKPEKILCLYSDPAILARDLKRLNDRGRSVVTVLPFDTAPQTAAFAAFAFLE